MPLFIFSVSITEPLLTNRAAHGSWETADLFSRRNRLTLAFVLLALVRHFLHGLHLEPQILPALPSIIESLDSPLLLTFSRYELDCQSPLKAENDPCIGLALLGLIRNRRRVAPEERVAINSRP
jgi:hypothetical protein